MRPARCLRIATVVVLMAALIGFTGFRGRPPDRPRDAAGRRGPGPPTSPTSPPRVRSPAVSTFTIPGPEVDELGNRSRRGYAFVIHTGSETSDLLTDYDLVVEQFISGHRSIQLQQQEQTFTAKIVAVSPDPHVALLRVSGRYPSLPLASARPRVDDSVTLGEARSGAARARVIAYSVPGHGHHLTFSVEVDPGDDGEPVLDEAGQVVGIAEPTLPYGVDGVGFAIPILAGCRAVEAC